MEDYRRLVVFDVEGIILPKRRFLPFEVASRLGPLTFLRFIAIGVLYEIGLLSLETALQRMFGLLKGISLEEIFNRYKRLPLMPGARELFSNLRRLGYRTALISSGLPRIFVEDLAQRLGADYASGLEMGLTDGHLTGEVWGEAMQKEGKAIALKEILRKAELSPHDCVVVADDRNNLPLLDLCQLSIGFNPDFILSFRSDKVIKANLLDVLPILTKETVANPYTLTRSMALREFIHMSGILVPFICIYLLSTHFVVALILMITSLYTTSEFLRMFGRKLPIISTITVKSAEKSELQEFAMGPIYFALGIAISLLIFPQPVSFASITVLTLGDSFAAMFGARFGRTVFPLNKGKNIEGSLFGWLFAFLGALLFIHPIGALVAATAGLLAECLPLPLNDNLVIPMASGFVLSFL